ncbi:uncharacterized protein B0I36DRAFT_373258 [Microdochium trichocladiopsis]|uniref:Rhodopsin domain-containing protein n=1 Tax=Microdochium trichocladiopsis TaxID=1682393 RepID=A0A9P8YDP4_9PEZI|nr:uncharacterized protein B0I36DRAFT_373258 [Microdochium trichocladiopsis]KAH7036010.1 hypothetical protein B0I36DRAFT_373258 [Microdochium trichocladiopsis]
MALNQTTAIDVACALLCSILIMSRCAYRAAFRCHGHALCHRRWRIDDFYMAFALLPLVARTVSIVISFSLNPDQSTSTPDDADAAEAGVGVGQLAQDWVTARKLLLPSRLCYAMFSLCSHFTNDWFNPWAWGARMVLALWWIIVLSFIVIVIVTFAECNPLSLAWELSAPGEQPPGCSLGIWNLLTMASTNIVTDLALIMLPFPILRNLSLGRKTKIQLGFLFGIGGIVVIITVIRIPFILISSVSQRTRSVWAAVEILCACIVANTAFFYAVAKDIKGHHHKSQSGSSAIPPGNFYLQSLPSTTRCDRTKKLGTLARQKDDSLHHGGLQPTNLLLLCS